MQNLHCKKEPDGEKKSPLQIYNVSTSFERIQINILDPLPTNSSENKYLLVIVNCFHQIGGRLSVEKY